jgi:hypothetical protein
MGKLVEPTLYKLTFADGPLQGAHVTVASMSVRDTWAYNDRLAEIGEDRGARYRHMLTTLASLITDWDLEKAPGEPWPLTLDGVLSLPDDWLPALIVGWLQAINGVPDPTGTAAADPSGEASLPMQPIQDETPPSSGA